MTDEILEERRYAVEAHPAETDNEITPQADLITSSPPFFQRLLGWLWPGAANRNQQLDQRLQVLGEAISLYPDAPANYVQRAELYLSLQRYREAAADFQLALALSSAQVEQSDWGVVAQMLQDRAQHGLKKAQARLSSEQNIGEQSPPSVEIYPETSG